MTGLLAGKVVLVTGVLTEASIAFEVARLAQHHGAKVILTGFGRTIRITRHMAERLPQPVPVVELDITDDHDLAELPARVREHTSTLDAVLHSIAFAPPGALGDDFVSTTKQDASTAFKVSAYSLNALTVACLPVITSGGSIVGLDFDASQTWPGYNWMGVSKAALEAVSRYLARDTGDRGVRVNLVACGPLRTKAATSIPGFSAYEEAWGARAPLGWDTRDPKPAALACIALMSDLFPATTGEIVHVDGGFHAVGV